MVNTDSSLLLNLINLPPHSHDLVSQESLREKVSKFDAETLGLRQGKVEQREQVDSLEHEAESLREQVSVPAAIRLSSCP